MKQIEIKISNNQINYADALIYMESRVDDIIKNQSQELLWFLSHNHIFTQGTSASDDEILNSDVIEVLKTNRGGKTTYHGPGQRVVYVMLDLNKRGKDVKKFVENLEAWIIHTLAEFNVIGQSRDGRVGIWVERPDKPKSIDGLLEEEKIAAIGVRVRKWITFHGLSINVDPDLSHFQGIVPCGIKEHGVTSLVDLGLPISMTDLDIALSKAFSKVF